MKENTIVSLADEKYFNLLEELIESIKCFPESKNIAICVLDAGLNQDQIDKIKNKVDEIKLDGVFIAIGHDPATQLFKDQLNMDLSLIHI